MKIIINEQMELGFEKGRESLVLTAELNKRTQANWWFAKMRQVVELAWRSSPPPRGRHQQTYLSLPQKNVRLY